ncbi:hypothetical protein [Streptomyces fructofermentans]|uniref:hypothetical protein n=1 Tax=Streptomyces fructofermentans TaxID=152141 RepID=UPI0037A83862
MKSLFKSRISAAAVVGALSTALTLGVCSTASAADGWQLRVCSQGSFQTNVYWPSGGFMGVPAGECRTAYWQRTSATSYVLHVDAYVNGGGYIAGADVNIARGAGLATAGSAAAPYMYAS